MNLRGKHLNHIGQRPHVIGNQGQPDGFAFAKAWGRISAGAQQGHPHATRRGHDRRRIARPSGRRERVVDIGPLGPGDRKGFRGQLHPAPQAVVILGHHRARRILDLHPLRRKQSRKVVEVGTIGRGQHHRAGRVVDPGAQEHFPIGKNLDQLSCRLAFEIDHPEDRRKARDKIVPHRLNQRLVIERLDNLRRRQP